MATAEKTELLQQQQQQQSKTPAAVVEVKDECNVCGAREIRLLRCARCKKVLYCGQQHQREDWKNHKVVCVAPSSNGGKQQYQQFKELSETCKTQGEFEHCSRKSNNENSTTSQKSTFIPLYSMREFDMNIDDYLITPSPARSKITADDISNREHVMKQSDFLVENLINNGYCIIDDYLGESQCARVLWDVVVIFRADIMKPGQVVSKTSVSEKIRGDKIAWITGTEEMYENMSLVMNSVDRLMRYCTGRLGNIKGRTPAMVACYPGDGTGYKRHVDNTVKDGRRITCLYYLNKGWDSEDMGGQLRMFPSVRNEKVDVDPIFDRLVVFWSDARTPHEVLPANNQRFAVTLWYFEAEEREQVKERYFSNLKNAFASNVQVTSNRDSKDQSKRVPANEVINQPTSSQSEDDSKKDECEEKS